MSKHANKVSRLRARLGEDHKTFGRRFGAAESTVYHWEAGTRNPSKAALLLMDIIRLEHDGASSAPEGRAEKCS